MHDFINLNMVKTPLKVKDRPIDVNVTEHKKFIDMIPDLHITTTSDIITYLILIMLSKNIIIMLKKHYNIYPFSNYIYGG